MNKKVSELKVGYVIALSDLFIVKVVEIREGYTSDTLRVFVRHCGGNVTERIYRKDREFKVIYW